MKYTSKTIIYVILVMTITLILCMIFIKPKILKFKTTREYVYIQKNRKDIEEVIIRYSAQLGESCYKLDTKKAYDILNDISVKKEGSWCSGPDIYLEFYFKNRANKKIHFVCENLFYDGVSYELKDKVILINKDEYIPDKITKGMITVEDKDKVDCK